MEGLKPYVYNKDGLEHLVKDKNIANFASGESIQTFKDYHCKVYISI